MVLGLTGLAIAIYLGLYQVDVVRHVWEPFFGDGSHHILKETAVSRLLPDAFLGAFMYFLDVIFNLIGGHERWRTRSWAVLVLGLITLGLAGAAIILVILQGSAFHAFCTLCLASAVCSLLIFALTLPEVMAAWQHVRSRHAHGASWWRALWQPGGASSG